jgi:hypothetical protein
MQGRLEEDRRARSLRAQGGSIEEALRQASMELGIPVKKLEYEILERGNKGLLGINKSPWVILAYEAAQKEQAAGAVEGEAGRPGLLPEQAPEPDRPGEVFVRLTHDGVFLKAIRPTGRGARASERQALELLSRRGITGVDTGLVDRVVRHAEGEYIKIGEYGYNPANQSTIQVEIADQEMTAYMIVTRPGPGGPEMTASEIASYLSSAGVVYGIREEVIRRFEDYPRYNETILVAEGRKAVNGENGRIVYNFNVDHSEVHLQEKGGQVDFKELNLVENVEAGQILARRIPAEPGEEGCTVTGRNLPAKPGKPVEIDVGKNVTLSEDGQIATAVINGQVLLIAGKINVEPVYTVGGDVNLHTGNILFLGTVVIKGSVLDGFSVKAAGNIEVLGSVGKCVMDAEGDIIIHQGIMGKNQGQVNAGLNVFAKFIEHARVKAEQNVIVSDGIIHSLVDANRRILCQGRRASIVGGRLRAAEEINAKSLGSVAGTETILEVGYDPNSKERLAEISGIKTDLEKQIGDTELNIHTIDNLRKLQKNIAVEKLQNLKELTEKRAQMLTRLNQIDQELAAIHNHLATLKAKGKISASDRVYPGVKLFIKNENLVVRNEFKKVTFYLQGKEIRMTKYEPIEEEAIRRS